MKQVYVSYFRRGTDGTKRSILCLLATLLIVVAFSHSLVGQNDNRLAYLDEFLDPYYVNLDFPKLITPQWVGDPEVEAVIVLAIDDMRDTARYENYLRPVLQRLKKIDGRAPVSIMTCSVDPGDSRLQAWLQEGLSIEVHTVDHPCPLLHGGDFDKAKSTYDRCIDLLSKIPGNKPVAFRMPCCDSQNTPSPRFWTEIFEAETESENYLSIDSSVFQIFTSADESLPRNIVLNKNGQERFGRYVPFPAFVNTIENYPYPYLIGGKCWEFPCMVPSDWQAQHVHGRDNPDTVADWKLALDATVIKQGVFCLVFHPHGWIRNDQILELIDYAANRYGERVKFLSFRECHQRLIENLQDEEFTRAGSGAGFQMLDINNDGFMDVINAIASTTGENKSERLRSRIWNPESKKWLTASFPVPLAKRVDGRLVDLGVKFGTLQPDGNASLLFHNESESDSPKSTPASGFYHFDGNTWKYDDGLTQSLWSDEQATIPLRGHGVRLRDLDNDGLDELIIAPPVDRALASGSNAPSSIYQLNPRGLGWQRLPIALPAGLSISGVSEDGEVDAGLRFIDINLDEHEDILFSDGQRYSLHLFESMRTGWSEPILSGRHGEKSDGGPSPIPMIVRRDGSNNGAWFHSNGMRVQNEDTDKLPHKVRHVSFAELLNRREKADR